MNHRSFGKSGDPSMAKHAATGKICSVLPLADPADGVVQNSHEMSITCGHLSRAGRVRPKVAEPSELPIFAAAKIVSVQALASRPISEIFTGVNAWHGRNPGGHYENRRKCWWRIAGAYSVSAPNNHELLSLTRPTDDGKQH